MLNELLMYKYNNGYLATILLSNGPNQIVKTQTSFEECKTICERWAQKNLTITYADANSQWSIQNKLSKPSQSQIDLLKRNNAYDPNLTKIEACTLIRQIIAQSHRDQKKILETNWRLPKTVYNNINAQK